MKFREDGSSSTGYPVKLPACRRHRPAPRWRTGRFESIRDYSAAESSPATFLVRFGSTWMPGPMVVETVTFLM
jgi:hypothetical protein